MDGQISNNIMLKLVNISKKLDDFELKNVNIDLKDGEYFVILGKSGAGKSVLLEIITGLIAPDTGQIFLDGKDITSSKIQKRNIGLVFQNHSLFPHLTVKQNILYPLKAKHLIKKETNTILQKLCSTLNIGHLLKDRPGTLSIGESQRVALARTLITSPKCILLDEPLSSLDAQTKAETKTLLRSLSNFSGSNNTQAIIHVTHDYEEAISLATKVAVIEDGTIAQIGTPEELFKHPKSNFIASFVGIKNFYRGYLNKDKSKTKESYTFYLGVKNKEELNNNSTRISIATKEDSGYGSVIIRSEDIILSNEHPHSSARNVFKGIVKDIENVKLGIEVTININKYFSVSSLITRSSFNDLKIQINKKIYLSFKATAAEFLKG